MSWIMIGDHKINTALICYVVRTGNALHVEFTGHGEAMMLYDDDAATLWRLIKAEDSIGHRHDAFHPVHKAPVVVVEPDVLDIKEEEVQKPAAKPAPPKPVGIGAVIATYGSLEGKSSPRISPSRP